VGDCHDRNKGKDRNPDWQLLWQPHNSQLRQTANDERIDAAEASEDILKN